MQINLKALLKTTTSTALAPAALTLVACASARTTETTISKKIGCDPDHVEILEHEPDLFNMYTETWVAVCNGRKFYCSSPPGEHLDGARCQQAFRY